MRERNSKSRKFSIALMCCSSAIYKIQDISTKETKKYLKLRDNIRMMQCDKVKLKKYNLIIIKVQEVNNE